MKFFYPTIAAACIALSACAANKPDTSEYERILSKDQYLELVADRVVKMEGSNFSGTNFSDGTMEGASGDNKLSGTWTWEDNHFCRDGIMGGKPLGRDCQVVEIFGNTLKVTRDEGKGKVVFLQLQ